MSDLRNWPLVLLLCAGCSVGPDYREPDPPEVQGYLPGALPATAGMPALVSARDLPLEWWQVFASPQIDALVALALEQSPDLQQAQARLVQARQLLAARAGSSDWPRVSANAGVTRQQIDPATFGVPQAPSSGPFDVFRLGAQVDYDLDLAGGSRRALESLSAEVDYQGFQLEAARLTLAGQVVLTAIRAAALDAQLEAVEQLVATQRRQLDIAEQRQALGALSELELHNQGALLAQAEAALPPLRAQRALAGHLLAVLTGEPPALASLASPRLEQLALPAELPLRLPAELVRHRPDVCAREALLRKASADVGVATAELYPRVMISGSFSSSQLELSDLLGGGINVWSLGGNLVQPLFRGGELRARERASEAAFDAALAGYRQAVLRALQDVADALRALEAEAQSVTLRTQQVARTAEVLRITRARLAAGGVDRLALLAAERAWQQAELERRLAVAGRCADVASLFLALGGGWEGVGDGPEAARAN